MNIPGSTDIIILAGNSHPDLAHKIAGRLGIRVGICSVIHAANRETLVDIGESVRGRDVYILQTGTKDVNNNIMELLIMAYACKTSCARKIVGVIPYLPYSKQSKMRKRGCIVSKLLAKMMCNAGLTHLITMDLHSKEVQGFFDIPVDNLRASPFLLQYIQESIPDYRNAVIVARNPGSAKKATSYAERLRLGIAVIHGEQKEAESDMVDGRYSPPPAVTTCRTMDVGLDIMPGIAVIHGAQKEAESDMTDGRYPPTPAVTTYRTMDAGLEIMPVLAAKEKPPINVVGDVGGRIAIMVDDMIDDVESFVMAAEVLKERGAYKIYVLATHGLLSSDAPRLLEASAIDEVVVTNTVPHEVQKMQCHKIKTVDISVLLSEAIRRIHNKESMSYLFRNVTLED